MNIKIYNQINKQETEIIFNWIISTYWGKYIQSFTQFEQALKNSDCYTVYVENNIVAFVRVISDQATFGYILDFYIDEYYRNKGIGSKLLDNIISSNKYKGVKWLLASSKAKNFYIKYGFKKLDSENMLEFKL